jgi:ElaB/YqjD/DUF883 family membrane-anchored ribosome-binding protein
MSDITSDLEKPSKKAARATRDAANIAKSTAASVAAEAKTFGSRSSKIVKDGAAQVAGNAKTVQSAAGEGADLIQARLRTALEALQQTSEEMTRWAGARATEAKDQASTIVQERPIGSVAGMFAIGALIGVVAGIALKD